MVWRLDVTLEQLAPEACSSLAAGEPVDLEPRPDGLTCCTRGGQALGTVPAAQVPQLGHGPLTGAVRTVKRADGAVAAVVVRFTRGADAAHLAAPPGRWDHLEGGKGSHCIAARPACCSPSAAPPLLTLPLPLQGCGRAERARARGRALPP